jgi:hydroxymethylpyrimidine pyrophosphatase-like HAD family hydrolase
MANATENVKNAADIITASNDEHGVAEAIKQYILNN